MKKLMLSLLVLSLISIVPGTGLKASAQDEGIRLAVVSEAQVLKVPRDYLTIQAAVSAAHSGDTIKVAAGVYNENVVISTSGLRWRMCKSFLSIRSLYRRFQSSRLMQDRTSFVWEAI